MSLYKLLGAPSGLRVALVTSRCSLLALGVSIAPPRHGAIGARSLQAEAQQIPLLDEVQTGAEKEAGLRNLSLPPQVLQTWDSPPPLPCFLCLGLGQGNEWDWGLQG